jgi:wyosine [tRNA(Phe)-imidazoG37] synthetase (radical SAM superfamily)
MKLTTKIHDRDAAGMTYVYPVVSRRARGVSLGINLNPNNACNWRCIYCQVPGLTKGRGPEIDLELLHSELHSMLHELLRGDYMEKHVPENSRRLNDIAFSGNGEPTSSPNFEAAIQVAQAALREFGVFESLKTILITNGSLIHKPDVQAALQLLSEGPAEVWFKLDSALEAGQQQLNDDATGIERTRSNLALCTQLAPTWLQTMALGLRGEVPSEEHCTTYIEFLKSMIASGCNLQGVLLYGLARKSFQPEAVDLTPLPAAWMEAHAERIRQTGLQVKLSL